MNDLMFQKNFLQYTCFVIPHCKLKYATVIETLIISKQYTKTAIGSVSLSVLRSKDNHALLLYGRYLCMHSFR